MGGTDKAVHTTPKTSAQEEAAATVKVSFTKKTMFLRTQQATMCKWEAVAHMSDARLGGGAYWAGDGHNRHIPSEKKFLPPPL